MRCKEIKELLSEHIDGVLDAKREAELQEHLASCEACRRELEALKQTVAMVHDLPDLEPPSDLLDRIHAEIQKTESEPQNSSTGSLIWGFFRGPQAQVALAASIVLAIGIIALHQAQRGELEPVRKPAPAVKPETRPDMVKKNVLAEEAAEVDTVDDMARQQEPPRAPAPVMERDIAPAETLSRPAGAPAVRAKRMQKDTQKQTEGSRELKGAIWGNEITGNTIKAREAKRRSSAPAPVTKSVLDEVADKSADEQLLDSDELIGDKKKELAAQAVKRPDITLTVTRKEKAVLVKKLSDMEANRAGATQAIGGAERRKALKLEEQKALFEAATDNSDNVQTEPPGPEQTEFVVTIKASEYETFLKSLKGMGDVTVVEQNEKNNAETEKDVGSLLELHIRIVTVESK